MIGRALTSLAALLLAGCQGAAEEPPAPPPAPAAVRPAVAPLFGGEPTGEAVFEWLGAERYRETWELLPGTLPLRPGSGPHGALVTAYASPVAVEGIERAALPMPPGAAFAIEEYFADSTLAAIGVMVRVRDPDPQSKGWYFTRFGPAGDVEADTPDTCLGCHVAEPDLVFGWALGTPLPVDSTGATAPPPAEP